MKKPIQPDPLHLRIYPGKFNIFYHMNTMLTVVLESFEGAIVGMMWSMKLEQQTWFGNEQWKCYGIQVNIVVNFV